MFKIGITGVGGGVGQSIIKCFGNTDYELIGFDSDPLAAGLYQVAHRHIIPPASSDEYIPALLDICNEKSVSILFPGLDAELPKLAANRDEFLKISTNVIISSKDVVEIAEDKLLTAKYLKKLGLAVPLTKDLADFDADEWRFPVLIKPRTHGARSKNVKVFQEIGQLNNFLSFAENTSNFVIQEYIGGEEFTCGSLTLDEKFFGVIPMRRILRDGDTYKCFSTRNQPIESTVEKICKSLCPFGALNVQLKLKNDIPYVFELNARCSGTTAARALCGFNEPKFIADFILKNATTDLTVNPLTVLRYWNEVAVENSVIESST